MWKKHESYGRIVGTIIGLTALLTGVFLALSGSLLWGLPLAALGGYELLKVVIQEDYSITLSRYS
jgi:hypothetical protein